MDKTAGSLRKWTTLSILELHVTGYVTLQQDVEKPRHATDPAALKPLGKPQFPLPNLLHLA